MTSVYRIAERAARVSALQICRRGYSSRRLGRCGGAVANVCVNDWDTNGRVANIPKLKDNSIWSHALLCVLCLGVRGAGLACCCRRRIFAEGEESTERLAGRSQVSPVGYWPLIPRRRNVSSLHRHQQHFGALPTLMLNCATRFWSPISLLLAIVF